MEQLKEVTEKLSREWEQFKQANDSRLKEIELKGRADPLLEEKVNKMSGAIGDLQKQLDDIAKKSQRLGAGAANEVDAAKLEHRKAFNGFLRKGIDSGLRALETKAVVATTDAEGAYLIPEELDSEIGRMEKQHAPIEAEVTSMNVGSEAYEKNFSLGEAESGWVGETDARPETDTPTLGRFVPTWGTVYANPKASQKMLEDSAWNVEQWLNGEVAEKFGRDLDLAIVSGNGTNKPKGFLAYTLAATADAARAYGTIEKMHSGAAGTFTADNLIDLIHKLNKAYRLGAKWVMAGTTVATIRKLKDANDNYIWQPGLIAGQQDTLLGYGIVEDDNMPVVAADANVAMFGNLRRAYKLLNRTGIALLRDPYTSKPYVHFYTTKRVGGGVEDTSAVKVLTLSL